MARIRPTKFRLDRGLRCRSYLPRKYPPLLAPQAARNFGGGHFRLREFLLYTRSPPPLKCHAPQEFPLHRYFCSTYRATLHVALHEEPLSGLSPLPKHYSTVYKKQKVAPNGRSCINLCITEWLLLATGPGKVWNWIHIPRQSQN